MKRVARTVMLVFAIITLVIGGILMAGWTFLLMLDTALKEEFPGTTMTPESLISFYVLLSVAIIFIAVSVLLFVLRARKTN